MKKGLLLSVAASAIIFAGGDIAPVEPAAPASADFWGQIGFAYQAQDDEFGYDWGDEENNEFSATVVLGVEKQLGYGFGFGAELAGWTDFGFDIANSPRVTTISGDQTSAEISQAYLTYSFGNTAIKAGRQALPAAVSPWAWSDRTAGVLDYTYDAVVVANTDLADTTLVGAWVGNIVNEDFVGHLANGSQAGIWMLAAINKSLANTTLSVSAYYAPNSVITAGQDEWSIWATATGNVDGIKWGLQGAYADADITGWDATYGIAAKVGSSWGSFDATLIAGYINDGDSSLIGAGSGLGSSAFWTDNEEDGDSNGLNQTAVLLKAGYKLPVGKIYGSLGYWNFDDTLPGDLDYTLGARLGYKFTVAGVNAKVEYRYRNRNYNNGIDVTRQRLRVEAYYKF